MGAGTRTSSPSRSRRRVTLIDTSHLNLAPGAAYELDVAFEGWDDAAPDRTGIYLDTDNGGGARRGCPHPV